jgi:putative phosphoribosyl transferase
MRFRDRRDAGRRLAQALRALEGAHPVVLALPRGGVPVGAEVARQFRVPMDVLVVRKIGLPSQPELGVGAVGEGGVSVFNDRLLDELGLVPSDLAEVTRRETREVHRRVERYRGDRAAASVAGRTVVVVDDGVATGFTARAAVEILRRRGAGRIVVAVPVGARRAIAELSRLADEVVCLHSPAEFGSIGEFYDDFGQLSDAEVSAILATASTLATASGADGPVRLDITLSLDSVLLPGTIAMPAAASGLVVFAHGSGSSRLSPRNQAVAHSLNQAGFATLLFDLLTAEEARDRALVFDLPRLASRLVAATHWVQDRPALSGLSIAYFGASTGAAAALVAAADLPGHVAAIVSRGGRPDLAGHRLAEVTAPTLLIVGGDDSEVLELNRRAQQRLHCPSRLVVVPGATHLFEEPGALDAVTTAATTWFQQYLVRSAVPGATTAS